MKRDSMSKIIATKNVIRNKFKKACLNRIENENNVNKTMKSLTAITPSTCDLESKNYDFSHQQLSNTKNDSPQTHLSIKSQSNHAIKSRPLKTFGKKHQHDPNALCDNLRILLASMPNVGDVKCMHQIKTILDELRKLGIII